MMPAPRTKTAPVRLLLVWLTAALYVAAVWTAYTTRNTPLIAQLLVAAGILTWFLPLRLAVGGYLATLGIQLPFSSGLLFRPAIADLFLLPVIVRTVLRDPRALLTGNRLTGPLLLLALAFLIAAAVGYFTIGRFTIYVVLNKLLGIGFLISGALVLIRLTRTLDDLRQLLGAFIIGISVTNLLVLIAAPFAMAGWQNPVYVAGSYRLFGTLLNPSAYGGILVTAAMLELALLSRANARSWWAIARWLNIWLLGLSVVFTLSRSTWLCAGAAAGTLFVAQFLQPRMLPRTRPMFWWTTAAWTLLPVIAMGAILYANRRVELLKSPEVRAAELHRLLEGCAERYHPICDEVRRTQQQLGLKPTQTAPAPSAAGTPSPAVAATSPSPAAVPPATVPPAVTPPAPVSTPAAPPAPAPAAAAASSSVALSVEGPLMNARGFQDRLAIAGVALKRYLASPQTMLTGIGLGTFLETSSADFGVPLIIHNTYVWLLVELGPLGFAAFAWFMGVTGWSLWRAWQAGGVWRQLSGGVIAASAGMLVFFMVNEGFYQRHFWLLFVAAERLRALSSAPSASVDGDLTSS